jgi:hypothetical protein
MLLPTSQRGYNTRLCESFLWIYSGVATGIFCMCKMDNIIAKKRNINNGYVCYSRSHVVSSKICFLKQLLPIFCCGAAELVPPLLWTCCRNGWSPSRSPCICTFLDCGCCHCRIYSALESLFLFSVSLAISQ